MDMPSEEPNPSGASWNMRAIRNLRRYIICLRRMCWRLTEELAIAFSRVIRIRLIKWLVWLSQKHQLQKQPGLIFNDTHYENKTSGRFRNLMRAILVDLIYAAHAHPYYSFGVCKHCNCSVPHEAIQNKQTWQGRATFMFIPPTSDRTHRH